MLVLMVLVRLLLEIVEYALPAVVIMFVLMYYYARKEV